MANREEKERKVLFQIWKWDPTHTLWECLQFIWASNRSVKLYASEASPVMLKWGGVFWHVVLHLHSIYRERITRKTEHTKRPTLNYQNCFGLKNDQKWGLTVSAKVHRPLQWRMHANSAPHPLKKSIWESESEFDQNGIANVVHTYLIVVSRMVEDIRIKPLSMLLEVK